MKPYPAVKLEPAEAGELLRGWMDDTKLCRLTPTLAHKFGWVTRPVRAALAERNRRASDALWADDYLMAREILLRDGLCDSFVSAKTEVSREVRKNRKQMQARTLERTVATVEMQKINGTHWGTVK
jgi:hypothetical protein